MKLSFMYLNGYPGVGKLAVARELSKLLPKSKVINNHQLIDPVAMLFERDMPEYQPLRQAVRTAVLGAIARSISTKEVIWICTDQQSSNASGSQVSLEYYNTAASLSARFVSIILTCEAKENERRLVASSRGTGNNAKLTDVDILREVRENEDIYHFGGEDELELELDVSNRPPEAAAKMIAEFIAVGLLTDWSKRLVQLMKRSPVP